MLEPRTVPHGLRRSSAPGYAVLLAVSVVILHLDLALGLSLHHRGQDDLELTIPYARALWRAIAAHQSPWWLPWIDGGTSAFARFPYLGPFYPAVLAFRGGDPLRALDWVLLAHIALAAFGVRAWLRALGGCAGAGLVAGIVFAGSSVWQVAAHEGYATEAPVWTWLPWALAAVERGRCGEPVRHGALAALALGALALGGHATDLYVGALAAALYLTSRLWTLRTDRLGARRLVIASAVAGTLGAGIGLAFWLPLLRTVDLSALVGERAPKPAIPHPILRLARPSDGWGTKDSLYVGLMTFAWIASAFRSETRRRSWPLALVALFALVLSVGPGSPIWRILGVLPGFAAIDQANVFSWPFALFAAALAGLGAAGDVPPVQPNRARLVAVARLLLLGDLTLYSLRGLAGSEVDFGADGQPRAPLVDPASCGIGGAPSVNGPKRMLVIERWAPEEDLELWRNDALRLGCIEDVRASAHLGSPRVRRVLRALGPWPVDWDTFSDDRARAPDSIDLGEASRATHVLDLLGVEEIATDVAVSGDGFEKRAAAAGLSRWVRRVPLPRYRLVTRVEVLQDGAAAGERVLSRSVDLRTTAVLEEGLGEIRAIGSETPGTDVAPTDSVQVERYEPGDILLRCRSRPGEVLIVGETWFPGWRATVDGRSVPLVRANYLHMALAPPQGDHAIHVTYSPPGLDLGVTIASSSALVAGVLAARRRRQRTA